MNTTSAALDPRRVFGVYDGPLEPREREEIEAYLRTGEHDPASLGWRGQNLFARSIRAGDALADALIEEVLRRSRASRTDHRIPLVDVAGHARMKVEPMVRGLFPAAERDTVLAILERSVIFLTQDNIAETLRGCRWPHSAWTVANLYLGSIDAELLGPEASAILGMSEATTCYVSLEYFRTKKPFDDFVVHEAAHVFHNCKRERVGLRSTRRKEWLLEIEFRKRETFAYACEAYSRISSLSTSLASRRALVAQWAERPAHDESVDVDELIDIVREAVGSRNGWKRILHRCGCSR